MNYFLIAGEASGDLHASNLMRGLKEEDPGAGFAFVGGDRMAAVAGVEPVHHFRDMNFMGFFDVVRHLGRLRRIMKRTKNAVVATMPDVLILVDYAGFNLRMARFASKKGIRVFYYIPPKVWAWRKGRLRDLKKYVDRLFVIFPFEVSFFQEHGMEVVYEGNPLTDIFGTFRSSVRTRETFLADNELPDKPIVALLAGSRRQEIEACLPEMIRASGDFPDHQFVVAGAPSVEPALYRELLQETGIAIVYDQTYDLLSHARAAVVTSGTATLETALFDVPQVVIYKTGKLTYRIGKLFVNFRFFSLVNLIFGRELVKELLQHDLEQRIRMELRRIIDDKAYRLQMRKGYAKIREMVGEPGASRRIAGRMNKLM